MVIEELHHVDVFLQANSVRLHHQVVYVGDGYPLDRTDVVLSSDIHVTVLHGDAGCSNRVCVG